MALITILIPCYNEEQSLPALYKAISEVADEIWPPPPIRINLNSFLLMMGQKTIR